jgi:hypothetical protein
MTYIGFRMRGPVSRVFVRLDGKVRYQTQQDEGRLVLTLVDTRVNVKNNERPLDTSFFDSPVTFVQAIPNRANTDIVIRLRETVPWSVKRIGTTIAVDFTRP